jgi:hypothetical protein
VEGADALGLIAEIGIAIAGFAGVIATLRAPGGRIGAYAAMRIGNLLAYSALAVLLALVPSGLHFAGLTNATIWMLSSSAMTALVCAVFLGTIQVGYVRGALPAMEERAPGQRLFVPYSIALPTGIIALQLANAAFFRELWPFYLGLLALTAHSLFLFAYILFAPSKAELQA